eukprot:484868-Rhodomonas_salina.1
MARERAGLQMTLAHRLPRRENVSGRIEVVGTEDVTRLPPSLRSLQPGDASVLDVKTGRAAAGACV